MGKPLNCNKNYRIIKKKFRNLPEKALNYMDSRSAYSKE